MVGDGGEGEVNAAANGEGSEEPPLVARPDGTTKEHWAQGGTGADHPQEKSEPARAYIEPPVGGPPTSPARGRRRGSPRSQPDRKHGGGRECGGVDGEADFDTEPRDHETREGGDRDLGDDGDAPPGAVDGDEVLLAHNLGQEGARRRIEQGGACGEPESDGVGDTETTSNMTAPATPTPDPVSRNTRTTRATVLEGVAGTGDGVGEKEVTERRPLRSRSSTSQWCGGCWVSSTLMRC